MALLKLVCRISAVEKKVPALKGPKRRTSVVCDMQLMLVGALFCQLNMKVNWMLIVPNRWDNKKRFNPPIAIASMEKKLISQDYQFGFLKRFKVTFDEPITEFDWICVCPNTVGEEGHTWQVSGPQPTLWPKRLESTPTLVWDTTFDSDPCFVRMYIRGS